MGVKLVYCLTNLSHDSGYFGFRHALMLFKLLEELSTCSDFEDNIDIGGVIEETIHSDNIGVVQVSLYFQLSDELLGNFLVS